MPEAPLVSIRVPPRHRYAFEHLGHLAEKDYEALFSTLESEPNPVQSDEMVALLGQKSGVLDSGTAEQLTNAILSLAAFTVREDLTTDEVARRIAQLLSNRLEEGPSRALEYRLRQILDLPWLRILAKATEVQLDAERTITDVRIYNDVRPVFEDRTESAAGAVLMHKIRIECTNSHGEPETLFFNAGSEALHQLQRSLNRSNKKDDAIRALLQQAGLTELESKGNADAGD